MLIKNHSGVISGPVVIYALYVVAMLWNKLSASKQANGSVSEHGWWAMVMAKIITALEGKDHFLV